MGGEGVPPSIGTPLPAAAASVLLALEDRLRPLREGTAIQRAAAEALGLWLGADRVAFAEAQGETLRVSASWSADVLPSLKGAKAELSKLAVAEWGNATLAHALPSAQAGCGSVLGIPMVGVRAALEVPVASKGSLCAVLMVHQATLRTWEAEEIHLAEATAARAWSAVERARADAAMWAREALVRAQADELAAIYASAPVGLCVLDREGRYLRINERLAANNGLPAAQHLGRTIREVLPGLAGAIEPLLQRALAGEELRGIEVSGTTPARPGEVRIWRESFVPMRDAEHRITGVTIAIEEITEERLAERRQAFLLQLESHLRRLPPKRQWPRPVRLWGGSWAPGWSLSRGWTRRANAPR